MMNKSLKTKDGKFLNVDSDAFKALNEKHSELFENVLREKDKFTNVIRTINW